MVQGGDIEPAGHCEAGGSCVRPSSTALASVALKKIGPFPRKFTLALTFILLPGAQGVITRGHQEKGEEEQGCLPWPTTGFTLKHTGKFLDVPTSLPQTYPKLPGVH